MPKIKAKAKLVENVCSTVDNQRTHNVVCDLSTAAGGTDKVSNSAGAMPDGFG